MYFALSKRFLHILSGVTMWKLELLMGFMYKFSISLSAKKCFAPDISRLSSEKHIILISMIKITLNREHIFSFIILTKK